MKNLFDNAETIPSSEHNDIATLFKYIVGGAFSLYKLGLAIDNSFNIKSNYEQTLNEIEFESKSFNDNHSAMLSEFNPHSYHASKSPMKSRKLNSLHSALGDSMRSGGKDAHHLISKNIKPNLFHLKIECLMLKMLFPLYSIASSAFSNNLIGTIDEVDIVKNIVTYIYESGVFLRQLAQKWIYNEDLTKISLEKLESITMRYDIAQKNGYIEVSELSQTLEKSIKTIIIDLTYNFKVSGMALEYFSRSRKTREQLVGYKEKIVRNIEEADKIFHKQLQSYERSFDDGKSIASSRSNSFCYLEHSEYESKGKSTLFGTYKILISNLVV